MITTQKTPVTALECGTGRCNILYGSADPLLNLATIRARQMAPDEMRSTGFRDGFGGLGTRASLCDNADYMDGWSRGHAARF